MGRIKKFVDIPVTKETRTKIKDKKGNSSYDKFLNDVMNFNLTGDQS